MADLVSALPWGRGAGAGGGWCGKTARSTDRWWWGRGRGGGEDEDVGGIPAGLRGRGGRWVVKRRGEAAGAASRGRGWGEDGIGEEEDDGRVCHAEEGGRSLVSQTRVICVHLFCSASIYFALRPSILLGQRDKYSFNFSHPSSTSSRKKARRGIFCACKMGSQTPNLKLLMMWSPPTELSASSQFVGYSPPTSKDPNSALPPSPMGSGKDS